MESSEIFTGQTTNNTKELKSSDATVMDFKIPAPKRNLIVHTTAASAHSINPIQLLQSLTLPTDAT